MNRRKPRPGGEDRSAVRTILKTIEIDESLRASFSAERLAIYRVPLPAKSVILRYDLIASMWRTHRGDRLYVVDSDPLGMFTKPTAIVVFGRESKAPSLFAVGHWNLFIDERAFPFLDRKILRKWAVHEPPAVFSDDSGPIIIKGKKDKKEEGTPVEKGVIEGPFPPDDPKAPNDDDPFPPDPPTQPPAANACKPVKLFYGICCEFTLETLSGNEALDKDTKAVTAAFKERGYDTFSGLAGVRSPDGGKAETFDEMMDGLAASIAKQKNFCKCPEDQLVIWIAAHGNKGQFQWKPFNGSAQNIDYTHLMEKLLAIPAIKNNPQKVYLIVLGCRSGTLWDDGVIPPGLQGMHVISSAPDSKTDSYAGTFSGWVVEAVQKAKSWKHFIAILKYRYKHAKGNKSEPRSGDVTGCFATVTLKSIAFAGGDIGVLESYATSIDGVSARGSAHLFHGQTASPGSQIFKGFFGPCGPGKAVDVAASVTVKGAQSSSSAENTGTISFNCDNQTYTGTVAVSVNMNSVSATFTFTFDITTNC
jgi:hypothetical protein